MVLTDVQMTHKLSQLDPRFFPVNTKIRLANLLIAMQQNGTPYTVLATFFQVQSRLLWEIRIMTEQHLPDETRRQMIRIMGRIAQLAPPQLDVPPAPPSPVASLADSEDDMVPAMGDLGIQQRPALTLERLRLDLATEFVSLRAELGQIRNRIDQTAADAMQEMSILGERIAQLARYLE